MNCPRRNGYRMHEKYLNAVDAIGRFRFITWRWLICGEVIDPVILNQRPSRPEPPIDRARLPPVVCHLRNAH
jgi:hypothetical protein